MREIEKLIEELEKTKERFLYHKTIVPFINNNETIGCNEYQYCSPPYYHECYGLQACVEISKHNFSNAIKEHNRVSASINEWFIVYCSELIKEKMKGFSGFNKINKKNAISLNEFTECQLLYILRDKLAHLVYDDIKIGEDKLEPYLAEEVAKEIDRRYALEEKQKPKNSTYSLAIDLRIIPLINGCIKEIKSELNK